MTKSASARQTSSQPRRHHYVPAFYLRGFSDRKHRVRVYRREEGGTLTTHVRNAAVETGFYDLTDRQGAPTLAAEELLSQIESDAADAIAALVRSDGRIDARTRDAMSVFMATLIMRTPEKRDLHRAMNSSLRDTLLREGLDTEAVDALFIRSGITEPSRNDDIRLLFSVAAEIAPILHAMEWIVGTSRSAGLVTSDHPLAIYDREPDPLRGTGLLNADELYFPLTERFVLIMLPQPLDLDPRAYLRAENVLFVNSLVAGHSYRYVFQNPSDVVLGEVMPRGPRPLGQVNGRDMFRPTA